MTLTPGPVVKNVKICNEAGPAIVLHRRHSGLDVEIPVVARPEPEPLEQSVDEERLFCRSTPQGRELIRKHIVLVKGRLRAAGVL